MNYVEYSKSYCHALEPKLKKIRVNCFSTKTSTADCRKLICGIIKNAKWTDKKVEFENNISKMTNKADMYYYVKNSIRKARETIID